MFKAEREAALIPADTNLGRYIWKASCIDCGQSFGGYEWDLTDPMKHHHEHCQVEPDNVDNCEGNQDEY